MWLGVSFHSHKSRAHVPWPVGCSWRYRVLAIAVFSVAAVFAPRLEGQISAPEARLFVRRSLSPVRPVWCTVGPLVSAPCPSGLRDSAGTCACTSFSGILVLPTRLSAGASSFAARLCGCAPGRALYGRSEVAVLRHLRVSTPGPWSLSLPLRSRVTDRP
jgi:hypothetical protein